MFTQYRNIPTNSVQFMAVIGLASVLSKCVRTYHYPRLQASFDFKEVN